MGERAVAIAALASRPVTLETIHFVEQLLDESEPEIRMAAILVLASTREQFVEARDIIRRLVRDPDAKVQAGLDSLHQHGLSPATAGPDKDS